MSKNVCFTPAIATTASPNPPALRQQDAQRVDEKNEDSGTIERKL